MADLFAETKSSILFKQHNLAEITQRLDLVQTEGRELVQICVVASNDPLPTLLAERAIRASLTEEGSNYALELLEEEQPGPHPSVSSRFQLTRKFRGRHRPNVTGQFLAVPTDVRNIGVLLMIEPAGFWRDAVEPFLQKLYPKVVRPFFTQSEMHLFFRNIQDSIRPQKVRALKLSARERASARDSRRKYESAVRWTDTDVETIFRNAKMDNVWFRSIAFELVSEAEGAIRSMGTDAKISKDGYVSTTGRSALLMESVVLPMAKLGSQRLEFLSKRDRRSTAQHRPRPITIRYDSEVFSSITQTRTLLEVMRKFDHGTCTVLHGNPYLHLSIVDNYDYSATDVWVLNKSDVLLVPQIKTSEAALKRLVNHIFENFSEGTLAEEETAEATI